MTANASILDEINIFQGTLRGSTLPLSGMPFGMIHWSIQSANFWTFPPEAIRPIIATCFCMPLIALMVVVIVKVLRQRRRPSTVNLAHENILPMPMVDDNSRLLEEANTDKLKTPSRPPHPPFVLHCIDWLLLFFVVLLLLSPLSLLLLHYRPSTPWSVNSGQMQGWRATHQPSPWMGDYGQFVILPQVGKLRWTAKRRQISYNKATAIFRPDYQKLDLNGGAITGEITATERAAMFRFKYNTDKKKKNCTRVIINCAGESKVTVDGRTVRGYSTANSGGVASNFAQYFVLQFDRDITHHSFYASDRKKVISVSNSADGVDIIANIEFTTSTTKTRRRRGRADFKDKDKDKDKDEDDDAVILRVGTSLISFEQAQLNMLDEVARSFDDVQRNVAIAWEEKLSLIEIVATEEQRRTFYSCFYRTILFPHKLYELNGSGGMIHWSPYDGHIHEGCLYGDTGIWDTFRTAFPLLSWLFPEVNQEILQGLLQAGIEGGTIPEWPSPGKRNMMVGQHSAAVFADAVVKGQTQFDVVQAYRLLRRTACELGEGSRKGLEYYLSLGYIPDSITKSVSITLDYAYDDWCIAQIGRTLGEGYALDVHTLTTRAVTNYKNLWDPRVGFMCPRNEFGQWLPSEPFDEFLWARSYVEGGPWQSSWFVPHDPYGLASLLGGAEGLEKKMDKMMTSPGTFHVRKGGRVIHEMEEMKRISTHFGQLAHSNQPSFNLLFLYNVAGKPWKTEYWTRRVLQELYSSRDDGFCGDEDTGSMSAWYIFTSLGIYPYCPGQPVYIYTSPLFKHAIVHLPNGNNLTIDAENADVVGNHYVQRRLFYFVW